MALLLDITQLSSHSSLKLADKEYLLDSFKLLINSSDRHDQIRLLTLAQKSISLRDSYGKLAVPIDWRGNTCLDPLIIQEIIDFLILKTLTLQY